ncbi:MAG: aminotransferase class V-fold PLP-dependent enzyme [Chloroflexi bacterium]|nr:aminotransferase class V-fold PLP-dependent enzyme [Chloroflexota bacterium]MBU1748919.1 aminotransferase class V-fold PLP-dependent enzyme [Chloroflexota bacterium]
MTHNTVIYFDNAATSWPKPPGVAEAMAHFLDEVGANPGRSGHHLSIAAGRIVYEAREHVANLFGAPDPLRVVFTPNVTWAINLVLHGLLRSGNHVVTTGIEHNAVMRPLRALEDQGVRLTIVPADAAGFVDPADIAAAIRSDTALVAVNHASNVCGSIQPLREIGHIVQQTNALLLADVAQSAGSVPIHLLDDGIDLLAWTGHKGLLGPTGTGGLILGPRVDPDRIEPLARGGTGSRSEEEHQPDFLPDKFEPGTGNAVGLAGLAASLAYIEERGLEAIKSHKAALTQRLIDGLLNVPSTGCSGRGPGVTVYGGHDAARQTATVSFNIAGLDCSQVGLRLDEEHGVLCRVGLHCAPAAHRTLGTFPGGAVRFGLGAFNTREEVDRAVAAVAAIAHS